MQILVKNKRVQHLVIGRGGFSDGAPVFVGAVTTIVGNEIAANVDGDISCAIEGIFCTVIPDPEVAIPEPVLTGVVPRCGD